MALNLPGLDLPLDVYDNDKQHGHFPTLRGTDDRACRACEDRASLKCHEGRAWAANTFTIRERVMLFFMDQITDKPGWEDKVFDEAIVAKWNKEALAIGQDVFDAFVVGGGGEEEEVADAGEGDEDEDDSDYNEDGNENDDDDEDDSQANEDSDDEGNEDEGNEDEGNEDEGNEDEGNDNYANENKVGEDDEDQEQDEVEDGSTKEEDGTGASDEADEDEPGDIKDRREAPPDSDDDDPAPRHGFVSDGEGGFSQAMFDWCICELQSKAKLMRESGVVAVHDGAAAVFKSDVAVDEALRADLCAAAAPLESGVPDWHPGSDDKVLDLVHPSLWPLVYGRTRVSNKRITIENCLEEMRGGEVVPTPDEPDNHGETRYSTKFQWLPSEVEIGPEGPRFTSYINNLHPVEHKALYAVLDKLLGRALPILYAAYDRVMAWQKIDTLPELQSYVGRMGLSTEIQPWNRIIALTDNRECLVPEVCKDNACSPDNCYDQEDYEEDDDDGNMQWYDRTHPPRPFLPRCPYVDVGVTSIRAPDWKNLQVIVKLANIHLTPEKPTYDGGSWHIEGLWNEHIVATALYYYDSANITDSYLGFRTEVDAELMQQMIYDYPQNEHGGFEAHYGVAPGLGGPEDGLTHQYIGKVRTNQGRLLVFPNVLQHRVSPFELVDKSKHGHRKIVAFFLVDPTTKVISTANVPPQQTHWAKRTEIDTRLPAELSSMIAKHIDCPFDFETAAKLREELMAERKAPNGDSAAIPHAGYYSFCEH